MKNGPFRNPDFEYLSQLSKSQLKAFWLKFFFKLSMLPEKTISCQVFQQIIFDQFFNLTEFRSGTNSVSDIDQGSDKFELIFDQLGKNVLDLFVNLNNSDRFGTFLLVLPDDITVERNNRFEETEINENLLIKDDLGFVTIVLHEILELSFIEVEIDTQKVISPVFGSNTLLSFWNPD